MRPVPRPVKIKNSETTLAPGNLGTPDPALLFLAAVP
jgi:hypothetical protein